MDELKAALVGGDPLARESGLSASDADAMRRAIIAAADTTESFAAPWPRPMFLAATLAVTVIIGLALGTRLPHVDRRTDASARSAAAANPTTRLAERRQLQFATPGGTRIIWVFDPEFNP